MIEVEIYFINIKLFIFGLFYNIIVIVYKFYFVGVLLGNMINNFESEMRGRLYLFCLYRIIVFKID